MVDLRGEALHHCMLGLLMAVTLPLWSRLTITTASEWIALSYFGLNPFNFKESCVFPQYRTEVDISGVFFCFFFKCCQHFEIDIHGAQRMNPNYFGDPGFSSSPTSR